VRLTPKLGPRLSLIFLSCLTALVVAAPIGLVTGLIAPVGVGVAVGGSLWVALAAFGGIRAMRVAAWIDDNFLVVHNCWRSYRIDLRRVGSTTTKPPFLFAQNPPAITLRLERARNPWHRFRGLPIEASASFDTDRLDAALLGMGKAITDAQSSVGD